MQHQLCVWLVSGDITDPDAHGVLRGRGDCPLRGPGVGCAIVYLMTYELY